MKKILSSSVGFGLSLAVSSWIYYAFTRGIEAETWYRAVFTAGFTFLLAVCILGFKELALAGASEQGAET